MKYCSLLLGAIFACANISAADYLQKKPEEKTSHKNLTFAVTFDNYGMKAQLAKGQSDSNLKNVNLLLRGVVGFDDKPAYRPVADEELTYPAPGNISAAEGTVSFWICQSPLTPGQKPSNIALFKFTAKDASQTTHYEIYEYNNNIGFHIWPTWKKLPILNVNAKRGNVRRDKWQQVTATWDAAKVRLYLNGELKDEREIGKQYATQHSKQKTAEGSTFGIPLKVWGETRKEQPLFDDILIYKRALTPLEVKRLYNDLAKPGIKKEVLLFEGELGGVDRKKDTMRADFNFAALPEPYRGALAKGTLKLEWVLNGPDHFTRKGELQPKGLNAVLFLTDAVPSGKYTLSCTLVSGKNRSPVHTFSIEKPDLSFLGNKLGMSDKVPSPWTPLAAKGRTIRIWNRVYEFGDGPFPVKITAGSQNVLQTPPALRIVTDEGEAKIRYQAGKTSFTERQAVLTGKGTFGKYSLSYVTKIDFDGMIRADFTIHGSPVIKSMQLTWQVDPVLREFLLTPELYTRKRPVFSCRYPEGPYLSQLWFVGKGIGFCYNVEHNANWVFPEDQKIFKANTKTGECSIDMIMQKVKLPADTPYHALFITTPTRPRVDFKRIIKWTYAYHDDGKRPMFCGDGRGLAHGSACFKPHPKHFKNVMAAYKPNTVSIYGTVDALVETNPVGTYFKKYYATPGAYRFTVSSRRFNEKTKKFELFTDYTLSACAASSAPDYILANIKELFEHPYGNRVWLLFFDLAENVACDNPLHGCGFKDKFGRDIKTFQLLNKRNYLMRVLTYAHANKRFVSLHAQNRFCPVIHSMADYWHPGEEKCSFTLAEPYHYTDAIPERVWQSEYCADTLGVNVVMTTSQSTRSLRHSEAAVTPMLLRDIEIQMGFMPIQFSNKVWNCLRDNGVDSSSEFHSFLKQKDVVSSNKEIRISYYKTSKGYVFILGNQSPEKQTGDIDFSKFYKSGTLHDSYSGEDYALQNGKISVSLRDRSFRILVLKK